MTLFAAIIVFILGTAVGSFLSVVVYRMDKSEKGIFMSRSMCPACKKHIKWPHLIPIFSWIFLRGKCAYCGNRISFHYLALELLTGVLFLLAFLKWNFVHSTATLADPNFFYYTIDWQTLQIFLFYIIEFGFLMAIFFYDLLHQEIPDKLSLPAIAIAIVSGLLFQNPAPLDMLIGGGGILAFFLLQFLISRGIWIGGGDLRLGALIGILLGWKLGLLAIVIAYITGSLFSLYLLARKKVTRKSAIPFGPFLVSATVISIFWGEKILEWYLRNFA